jgi:hypothetical protein
MSIIIRYRVLYGKLESISQSLFPQPMDTLKPLFRAALALCCLFSPGSLAQQSSNPTPAATAPAPVALDASMLGAFTARAIGPATMSGRIAALDVVNTNPKTIYVGAASGGVWKSADGGLTFRPVFDKHTQSIGALTIDQSRPETVWVGTGERLDAQLGLGRQRRL